MRIGFGVSLDKSDGGGGGRGKSTDSTSTIAYEAELRGKVLRGRGTVLSSAGNTIIYLENQR